MPDEDEGRDSGVFDVAALAASLPDSTSTLLVDRYMTNRPSASSRVFRVYRPTPPHYHVGCDEHLYLISGRVTFWMGDPGETREVGPGQMLVFPRGTVHAMPEILAHPVVFLSIDTPRRTPRDIVFVDPAQGSPATFMQRNADDR